jgi:DNA-binding transcriptional MocR family regulator
MSPGLVFERVYLALKAELGSGRLGAGAPLEPAILSQDLNASITPVRDALHRLVGEGLAEAPRGDGFRTPFVTEIDLRHLYRWHFALLNLAIRAPPSIQGALPPRPTGGDDEAMPARTENLFLAIVARAGNHEHLAALARAGDRLRPARHVECRLLADGGAELDELSRLHGDGEAPPLRKAILRYHRRRERLTPEIVAALHDPG